MELKKLKKLFKWTKNPIIVFLFSTILLAVYIMCCYKFQVPQYYTDKQATWEMLNSSPGITLNELDAVFHNTRYNLQNGIMQSLLVSLAALIFSLIFKIKTWKNFLFDCIENNKVKVYLFFNIIFPIWTGLEVMTYMIDLDKYVYPSHADSMSIPFFNAVFSMISLGFLYYPSINILTFIILNTKSINVLYLICYTCSIAYILFFMSAQLCSQFSWLLLPQYLIYFIFIYVFLGFIKFLLKKRKLYKKV